MSPEIFHKICLSLGFVYKQSIHADRLTEEYTGELDIPAASAKERACWISQELVSVNVKKKLLLSTWYFFWLNEQDKLKIVQFFEYLLRAGYAIAITSENGIQAITDSTCLQQQLSTVVSVSPEDDVARNDTVIIRANLLQNILNHLNNWHQLDQKPDDGLPELSENTSIPQWIALLGDTGPQDDFSVSLSEEPNNSQLVLSRLSLRKKIRHLTLSSVHISINDIDVLVSKLKHLTQLTLNNITLDSDQLTRLVNMPGLEKLTMIDCEFGNDTAADISNTGLTQIHLVTTRIDGDFLLELINKNPGLERLSINNCELHQTAFNIPPGHLQDLKQLDLEGTRLTNQQKAVLANAAPNLESLHPGMSYVVPEGTVNERDARRENPLLAEQARRIAASRERAERYALKKSPRLKESDRVAFFPQASSSSGSTPDPTPWPLNRLHRAFLNKYTLNETALRAICSSPFLFHLDLSESEQTQNALEAVQHQRVPSLIDCRVDKTHITGDGLQVLFDMAPNLGTLSVQECKLIDQGNSLNLPGKRGQLSFFCAASSSLNTAQLNSILQAEPNISSLNLSGCSNINLNLLQLKPGQLARLTDLNVFSLHITPQAFDKLWQAAPNLVNLIMTGCTGQLPASLSPGNLASFKAELSQFDTRDIQVVVQANPRLTMLSLSGCKLLAAHEWPRETRASALTTLNAFDIHIDEALWEKLLYSAENVHTIHFTPASFSSQQSITADSILSRLIHLTARLFKVSEIACPAVIRMLTRAPCLHTLELTEWLDSNTPSASLAALKPGSLSRLRLLRAQFNSHPDELAHLLRAAPFVEEMDISFSLFNFSRFAFTPKLRRLPNLLRLNIANSNSSFQQLLLIIQAAPDLMWLNVQGSMLTEQEINTLCNQYPNLLISGTPQAKPACSSSSVSDAIKPDGCFGDSNRSFRSQQIFIGKAGTAPISTCDYHLFTYTWDVKTRTFRLWQPDESTMTPVAAQIHQHLTDIPPLLANHDADHCYAQTEIPPLLAHTWYQLPASSLNDELKHIAGSIAIPDMEMLKTDLGYHFFRLKTTQYEPILLRYIIRSGRDKELQAGEASEAHALVGQLRFGRNCRLIQNDAWCDLRDLSIAHRIAALRAFCHFETPFGDDFKGRTWQLFNHLIKHRTGSCRHRAQLFTVLAIELGLFACYQDNRSHAFAIVRGQGGVMQQINLGGTPGALTELPLDDDILDDYLYTEEAPSSTYIAPERIPAPEPSNRYLTWNNRPLHAHDAPSLLNELIARKLPRQLLVSEDKDSIEALHQAFEPDRYSLFSRQLDDVSLTSHRIAEGEYHKVPSPIAHFMNLAESNPDEVYTWFINWSDAEAKHKGLNSLVANTRRLQGRILPDNLRLLVLLDRDSLANMNEEFKRHLPYRSVLPRLAPVPQPVSAKSIDDDDVLIVNPADWKHILLGQVSTQGQRHEIIPGALFRRGKAISIQNAPQDNRECRMFLNELKNKRFYFNGEWHALHCPVTLHQPIIQFPPAMMFDCREQAFLAVNHSNYKSFFERTRIDESGIHSVPGLLEAHSHQEIHLTVTQDLSELQCLKLVREARDWGINVIFEPLPQVTLPESVAEYIAFSSEMIVQRPVTVYVSNDLDYVAACLGQKQFIPISRDTRFETLFIDVKRDEQDQFTGKDTDLLCALKRGEDIVLKGKFSDVLVHKLQSLFTRSRTLQVNGEEIPITGKLILLSDDEQLFAGVRYKRLDYKPEKSFARLSEPARLRLQACYKRLNIPPCFSHFRGRPTDTAAQMAWVDRLEKRLHLSTGAPLPETVSSVLPAATTPAELIAQLRHRPFVFLISASGAGKSHLMQRSLPAYDPGITVYHGLAELEKWLNHKDGVAYLFIDEANISTQDYLIFDSLMRGESVIWLNGKRYEIPPTHKIVFAGNPYAYGGRMQADLFRRNPYYMEFRAQPLREMLQPLLTQFEDQDAAFEMIDRCYHQALEAGITFTPRNAFMICQRVFEMKPSQFPEPLLLQQAILAELKGLRVEPSNIKPLRRHLKADPLWQAEGKALQTALQQRLPEFADKDFHWTPSRSKIAVAALAYLAIRQQRMDAPENMRQGVNGFMLEGRGLGKGLLLRNLLQALEISYVTVALDNPAQAREQLRRAYREGKLVFIPKFSNDADERLLNDLLSELDPKKNPGFGVIAVHDGGPLSKALSNRFTCMNLKEDRVEDVQQMVKKRLKPPEALLDEHVREYEHAMRWGKQAGLTPLPEAHALFEAVRKEMDDTDETGATLGNA